MQLTLQGMQMEDNTRRWRGTKLSLVIEGHWQIYRSYILRYLRQIAVITPYAQFAFGYIAADAKNSVSMMFNRRTDTMPVVPKQVRRRALPEVGSMQLQDMHVSWGW